jgi:hypothetical protein
LLAENREVGVQRSQHPQLEALPCQWAASNAAHDAAEHAGGQGNVIAHRLSAKLTASMHNT